jgi:hypothetical protein
MKRLRYLENLENKIRGWLPREPESPYHQKTPHLEKARLLVKPAAPFMDIKVQRNIGIAFGLGLGILLVGLVGCLDVNRTYSTLERYFSFAGVDPKSHYLFRDLTDQMSTYLMVVVMGVFSMLFSLLCFKSRFVQSLLPSNRPNARLAGGLEGGGGAAAFGGLRFLFLYAFTGDQIELYMFIAFFCIGAFLVGLGILVGLRRK